LISIFFWCSPSFPSLSFLFSHLPWFNHKMIVLLLQQTDIIFVDR
jgi:hypothetical protein